MEQTYKEAQGCTISLDNVKTISLFPGINMGVLSLTGDKLSVHHKKSERIMVIHYCRSGRIGWKMGNGNYVYLGAGDFSVHTMNLCADSEINLPNGSYEGLLIYIDLQEITKNPPALLAETGITGAALYEKLCQDDTFISFPGNEHTEMIFRFFFHQPKRTQFAYRKIKVLELLLYLHETDSMPNRHVTEYQAEQIAVIRKIHEQLMSHLEQRFTIEQLSKQYLMNPTTMKALFKSIYGTSIAAHMKEHRMQLAAKLLLESEMNIAQIASAVGYDSQSKFSTAFKSYFHLLPKEYRKKG